MNETVNLLRRNAVVSHKSAVATVLRFIAIVSLLLVAFIAVGMFILRMQSQFPALQQQEQTLQKELGTMQDKVAKYVLVKDRVRAISGALAKRSDMSILLDAIAAKVPNGVIIEVLKVDEKKVELNVASPSLALITTMFDNITEQKEKNIFSQVTMENLSYDPKNVRYSVLLRATLL